MKQKTVIKQAIELLEQQRKALQEMDLLGVLLENELIHKSNQINSIQLLLAKLIPTSRLVLFTSFLLASVEVRRLAFIVEVIIPSFHL